MIRDIHIWLWGMVAELEHVLYPWKTKSPPNCKVYWKDMVSIITLKMNLKDTCIMIGYFLKNKKFKRLSQKHYKHTQKT